jgi:hypothetical protein
MKKNFLKFYFGVSGTKEFEEFVYRTPDLEKLLAKDDYLALVSFDYKDKLSIDKAKKLVSKVYKKLFGSSIYEDRALEILDNMLDQSLPLPDGCRNLANLRQAGFGTVDVIFEMYSSELEDKPDSIDFYKERIKNDVVKQIDKIRN